MPTVRPTSPIHVETVTQPTGTRTVQSLSPTTLTKLSAVRDADTSDPSAPGTDDDLSIEGVIAIDRRDAPQPGSGRSGRRRPELRRTTMGRTRGPINRRSTNCSAIQSSTSSSLTGRSPQPYYY